MRLNKQALVGAALLVVSAVASAQAYGVISVGTSRLNLDCDGAASCDRSGNSFKLLGGYTFMPNLAGEFGYFDFGKWHAADSGDSLDVKTTAIGGGIAFRGDLSSDWNYVARLGLARVRTKVSAASGSVSSSDSDNNIQPYLGLGIGYKLNKTTSLDLAWDYTKSKYNKNGVNESANANSFNLGLTFGF